MRFSLSAVSARSTLSVSARTRGASASPSWVTSAALTRVRTTSEIRGASTSTSRSATRLLTCPDSSSTGRAAG